MIILRNLTVKTCFNSTVSVSIPSRAPGGSCPKISFVGANTVRSSVSSKQTGNGHCHWHWWNCHWRLRLDLPRVSVSPLSSTRSSRVPKLPLAFAVSTTFMTLSSIDIVGPEVVISAGMEPQTQTGFRLKAFQPEVLRITTVLGRLRYLTAGLR